MKILSSYTLGVLAGFILLGVTPASFAFTPLSTGQISPDYPLVQYQHSTYAKIQAGSGAIEREQYARASQVLCQAVEANPTMVLGQYNYGYALMKQAESLPDGQAQQVLLDRAEWAFLRARDISPEVGVTYFKLGRIALMQSDYAKASQYYEDGAAIYPNNPALWFNIGAAQEKLKSPQKAEVAYLKAVEVDPSFVFAYNNLGLLYEESDLPQKAETMYRQALSVEPGYNYARLNLGTLLQSMGRLDEAESLYREAIALEPENPWAHLYLGNACFRKNHYQEALAAYQRVASLNPKYPATYYLMSLVLHKLNRTDEALASGLQYIHLEPHGTFAKEATEMILTLRQAKKED